MNDNEQWHDEQGWDNQGSDNQQDRHDNPEDQGQDTPPQESGEQPNSEHQESHDSSDSSEHADEHFEGDQQPADAGSGEGEHEDAAAQNENEQFDSAQAEGPDAASADVEDVLGVADLADADEVVMTTVSRARAALSRPTTAYSRINSMIRRRDRKPRIRILIEEFQVEEIGAGLRVAVRRPRLRFPAVDVLATSRAVADRAAAPTRAARLRATQEAHQLRTAAVSRVESGRGQAVARMSAVQAHAAAAGQVGRVKAQGLVHDGLGAAVHRAADPVAAALGRLRGRLGALGRDSGRNLLPHVDLPHLDLPKVDLPHLDLPKVDLPKVDLPKVDAATFSQPLVDLRAEIRDEFRGLAQEADKVAHTASEALGRAKKAVRR